MAQFNFAEKSEIEELHVINDAELKAYSKNWHKPAVAKDLARYDQVDPDTKVEMLF